MPKKVIIIGAGIAGLTAGIHLQRNGYDTEIYELHSLPGGLCTAWERKGYTIDGCLHWLVASGPGDEFYHLWDELIDMKNLKCHEYDTYLTVEDGAGKTITVYTDIDKLEREFLYDRRGAGSVTITDRVEFAEPAAFESALISLGKASIESARVRLADEHAAITADVTVEGAELEFGTDTINQPPHPARVALRCRGPVTQAVIRTVIRPA